ncbi:uncharacterized protein LOC62_07G009472 [Vanrija pseudolonga]|uniref:Uncharacterized protein n=1 Tax=Vanrija pseudolonga TaxID=143232 RepID=A0AAF0YIS4_9TREE|nr:hypothetical protein LOC62_07G009472 [Vanrija pseudolonga]
MSIQPLRPGWSPVAYFPPHKTIGVHIASLTNIWVEDHPFVIPTQELVDGLRPWFTPEAKNLLLLAVDQHALQGDAESLVMKCSPKCSNRIRNSTELQVYNTPGAGAFLRRGIEAGSIPTDGKGLPLPTDGKGLPVPKKKRHRMTKKKKRPAALNVSETEDKVEPEDEGFLGDAESVPSTAEPAHTSISEVQEKADSPPPFEPEEEEATTPINSPVVKAWYDRPEQSCFCNTCLDPPERYARIDDSDLE